MSLPSYREFMLLMERAYWEHMLNKFQSVSRATKEGKVNRTTMYKRLKKLKIETPCGRSGQKQKVGKWEEFGL